MHRLISVELNLKSASVNFSVIRHWIPVVQQQVNPSGSLAGRQRALGPRCSAGRSWPLGGLLSDRLRKISKSCTLSFRDRHAASENLLPLRLPLNSELPPTSPLPSPRPPRALGCPREAADRRRAALAIAVAARVLMTFTSGVPSRAPQRLGHQYQALVCCPLPDMSAPADCCSLQR